MSRAKFATAIRTVSDWLQEVDDSGHPTVHADTGQVVKDPLDTRNRAIRELVVAYLEYQQVSSGFADSGLAGQHQGYQIPGSGGGSTPTVHDILN